MRRSSPSSCPTQRWTRATPRFETTSANSRASVNYPAFAGSPPQRARDERDEGSSARRRNRGGKRRDRHVGTQGEFDTHLIAGAFGVEYQSTSMANRPAISDSGQVLQNIPRRPAQLGRGHRCRRLGSERIQHFVLCCGPVRNRSGASEGDSMMSIAKSSVERQLRILEVWLDSGIGATELNQRRERGVGRRQRDLVRDCVRAEFQGSRPARSELPDSQFPESGRHFSATHATRSGSCARRPDAIRPSSLFRGRVR